LNSKRSNKTAGVLAGAGSGKGTENKNNLLMIAERLGLKNSRCVAHVESVVIA
jgi:hypothetical protein